MLAWHYPDDLPDYMYPRLKSISLPHHIMISDKSGNSGFYRAAKNVILARQGQKQLLINSQERVLTMRELWQIFLTFFKIGTFTLGGGYAMLPLIQREVVEKNGWVDNREFIELLALAQTSPGPIAINAAVFVGYKHKRVSGSLVACLGITLPSFMIILIIAMYLIGFRDNHYVASFFKGIRPAVVALIAAPLFALGKAIRISRWGILLASLVAAAIAYAGVSPAVMVVTVALLGLISGIFRKRSGGSKDAPLS